MKLTISVLIALFSFNIFASTTCGLSFWNTEIEKLNESYARGEMDHQTFFAQTRKIQKMIGHNTYECIFAGKTADLTKEAISLAKAQLETDKKNHLENAKKLLDFELKQGSVPSAVKAKMALEALVAKFAKIETKIDSL